MIDEIKTLKETPIAPHECKLKEAHTWNLDRVSHSGSWVGDVCDMNV